MTPGKPDIHQRVAERIVCEGFDEIDHLSTSLTAAILEEEYGPIVKAATHAVLLYGDLAEREGSQVDRDAAEALSNALWKKGLL